MNKIIKTKVGDEIHYFVNGQENHGVVAKMSATYVTIFKEDGKFYQVPLDDTFFVKDILVNKTWDDMSMEERTEQLQLIKAYSPRYLSKSWEQLPKELQDVLKIKFPLNPDTREGQSTAARLRGGTPDPKMSLHQTGATGAKNIIAESKTPTPKTGQPPMEKKNV